MAVQDYFANYTKDDGASPIVEYSGVRMAYMQKTVTLAAADDNNSTYLLFKDVPGSARIARFEIETEAISGSNDWNIGIANARTGTVIDDNCFADALDFSSAATKVAPLDGLKAVTHANTLKCMYEHAAHTVTTRLPRYDIVATGIAVGSEAKSFTARLYLIPAG